MKFFILYLVLAVTGARAMRKPRAPAAGGSGGGGGSAQVGGCSAGAGVEATADGNSAGGTTQASADGSSDTSEKYTYTIKGRRSSHIVPAYHPVLYMYYQVSDNQNMTYFERIDSNNPFILEYYMSNDDANYGDAGEIPSSCDDPVDGTWNYVAVKLVQGGLMPGGKCPVEKGNYAMPLLVDPFTVTFQKKIPCGSYTLTVNLDRHKDWALQADFNFNINEDSDCIPN